HLRATVAGRRSTSSSPLRSTEPKVGSSNLSGRADLRPCSCGAFRGIPGHPLPADGRVTGQSRRSPLGDAVDVRAGLACLLEDAVAVADEPLGLLGGAKLGIDARVEI